MGWDDVSMVLTGAPVRGCLIRATALRVRGMAHVTRRLILGMHHHGALTGAILGAKHPKPTLFHRV